MCSKRKIWIVVAIFLIIIVQLVVIFYAIPFVRINNLFKTANNRTLSEIEEVFNDETHHTFICKSDYVKMHIVEDELDVEEYVKVTAKKKITLLNISSLKMTCDTKATVYTTNSMTPIREYSCNLIVTFVFENGRWMVTSVDNHL